MAYTSGAPRNTDPAPWRVVLGPWSNARVGVRIPDTDYEPRSEFDLPPRDDANPILVRFRRETRRTGIPVPKLAERWARNYGRGNSASAPQIVHALRVLRLLASLPR